MLCMTRMQNMIPFIIMSLLTTGIYASDCGRYKGYQNLVAKGEPVVDPSAWPWIVGLFHRDQISTVYMCGGTLISRSVVVTAAHCLEENEFKFTLEAADITLVMGRTKVQKWRDHSTVQIRNAQNVKIHPSYEISRINGIDLAFIELDFSVNLTDYVTPVCLWNNTVDYQLTGEIGTVVGWGRDENFNSATEIAKMTELPIVDKNVCLQSNAQFKSIVNDNAYCAGKRDGTGPCTGDSGSGMVVLRTGTNGEKSWVLRGVVSRSLIPDNDTTGCDLFNYIVFTDMANLKPWITDNSCSFKHPQTFDALNMVRLGDKYYFFEFDEEKVLTNKQAKKFCQSHGLQLASIETEEENNLIVEYAGKKESSYGWAFCLGGSDSEVEGTWRWTNGQQFNFTDWNSGEPINYRKYFDCLEMIVYKDGQHHWKARHCSKMCNYVCELEDTCS